MQTGMEQEPLSEAVGCVDILCGCVCLCVTTRWSRVTRHSQNLIIEAALDEGLEEHDESELRLRCEG